MRLVLLTAMILVTGTVSAWACSPAPADPNMTVQKAVENIMNDNPTFLGKVRVDTADEDDKNKIYTMTVLKQYVGKSRDTLLVKSDKGDSCGAFYSKGSEFLIQLGKDTSEPQHISMFASYFYGMNVNEIEAYLDKEEVKSEVAPK